MIEDSDSFLEQMGLGEVIANFKLRIISEIYDLLWLVKNELMIQNAFKELRKFQEASFINMESLNIIYEFLTEIKIPEFSLKRFDEFRENLSIYYRLIMSEREKNIIPKKVIDNLMWKGTTTERIRQIRTSIENDIELLGTFLENPKEKWAEKIITLIEETITPFDANMLNQYLGCPKNETPTLLLKKDSNSHKNIKMLLNLYLAAEDKIKIERIVDLSSLEKLLKNINEKGQDIAKLSDLHLSLTYLVHASNSLISNYVRDLISSYSETNSNLIECVKKLGEMMK